MYVNIHSRFISNCWKLESIEVRYIQSMKYYLAKKRMYFWYHNNVARSQLHFSMWKTPELTGHILHDSTDVTLWKTLNYRDGKQISSCQRLRVWEGLITKGQEDIWETDYWTVPYLGCDHGYLTICVCQNSEWYTERMKFTLCKLYLITEMKCQWQIILFLNN